MGIKNLFKFLESYDSIIIKKPIINYRNKKIAIDISILIYQIVISIRNSGTDIVNKKGEIVSHLLGLFNKTISFLEHNIIPIYIFDGKPPKLKNNLLKSRKLKKIKAYTQMKQSDNKKDKIKYFKRCVTITRKHMNDCRILLDLMGVPYINAPEEADSQCAILANNGLVDAVATEDMDILTFGAPCILRNFSPKNKYIIEINLNNILTQLNITQKQFINLCIFFGCDYCPKLYGLTKKEILDNVRNINVKYFLDNINNKYNKLNYNKYSKAYNYFTNPNTIDVNDINFKLKPIKYNKLIHFLVYENGFNKYKINKKLKYLLSKQNTNIVTNYL